MSKRNYHHLSILLLTAMLVGLLAQASQQAPSALSSPLAVPLTPQATTSPGLPTPIATAPATTPTVDPNVTQLPTPVPVTATPIVPRHLPSLYMTLHFSANTIQVGDTIPLTITVNNQAPDPGQNVILTLLLPAGVVQAGGQMHPMAVASSATPGSSPTPIPTDVSSPTAVSSPNASPTAISSPTANSSPTAANSPTAIGSPTPSPTPSGPLTWSIPLLAANSAASFTATVRLTGPQPGGGITFQPQVIANGLPRPITLSTGFLVIDHSGGPVSARYTPGTPVTLRSSDNQVTLNFPAAAYTSPLTLQHSFQPPVGNNALTAPDIHRHLDPFFLTATDDQGGSVHHFNQPLTITVGYTPTQLDALNIVEGDLRLSWYDDTNQQWVLLPSTINAANHTVSAQVDHFSGFVLGDGSSPSAEFIPSLQGWQVDPFTGAATYSYPFNVPVGPNGLKPYLTLGYNSSANDGTIGARRYHQAEWVGHDWSLDTGSIALNMSNMGQQHSVSSYNLVLNGQSFDLMPECPSIGYTCSPDDISSWRWSTSNDAFLKIQAVGNGLSNCSGDPSTWRGGCHSGTQYPRYKWQIWTKDGTMYEYAEDAWWGFHCITRGNEYMETYKWQLSRAVDTYGNTINYSYSRNNHPYDNRNNPPACGSLNGMIDLEVWPQAITWGAGTSASYQVVFTTSNRAYDTQFEGQTSEEYVSGPPRQTQELDHIAVNSNPDGSGWQLMRRFDFSYYPDDPALTTCSDYSANQTYDPGSTKLTLKNIQRASSGQSVAIQLLPATAFTYGPCSSRGNGRYPNPGWNRLTHVDNGEGGSLDLAYEDIGAAINWSIDHLFDYNQRVVARTLMDGQSHGNPPTPDRYTWSYVYQHPAYNWLGNADPKPYPVGEIPNSAPLWYNQYILHAPLTDEIYAKASQFRGHSVVTETDPLNNLTVHYFYQGDIGCSPNPSDPYNPACSYNNLRDRQPLIGREYRTKRYGGSVPNGPNFPSRALLSQVDHSYQVCTNDLGTGSGESGVWRSFSAESQTVQTSYDQWGMNPRIKTTNYSYDVTACTYDWPPNRYGPTVYGNLTSVQELGNDGAVLRTTTHSYAVPNDASNYIVDHMQADRVYDAQGNTAAITFYLYDGLGFHYVGSHGSLTLVRKIRNTSDYSTWYGSDMAYSYDGYGNANSVTTYTGEGSADFNGNWVLGPSTGTPRTTSTGYDPYFHVLPVQITHPLIGSEYANYNWRMGTMTSVTDVNGNATTAGYDDFGRMNQMTKPGDGGNNPTEKYFYYDNNFQQFGQPFKYSVWKYVDQSGHYRPLGQFYDGLGRLIQTKAASMNFTQNIVEDKVYDGLSEVTQDSQPRYVNETDNAFSFYTPINPDNSVERWTSTSYDSLGRAASVTAPDNTVTQMSYGSAAYGPSTTSIDANQHQKRMEYDVFGRLTAAVELTGTTGLPYATTTYTYSPLDLLTQTHDQLGNTVTMFYDSLGRKTGMSDPDMSSNNGSWSYSYDPNGNLTQQTDAKNQTITFSYDALDRLTRKDYSNGDPYTLYNYDERPAAGNKGQRTSMYRGSTAVTWDYDARGRVSQVFYSASGRGPFNFVWSYDSADRTTSINYGGFELVSYSYDDAWRPNGMTTNYAGGSTYVSAAHYTALGQATDITLGNTVVETYNYSTPMARLSQLQVTSGGSSLFNRSYGYDPVGNVQSITNNISGENQVFGYDPLDRLVSWNATNVSQQYYYDPIGNLTAKAGVAYTYGSNGNGSGAGPHQARTIGGQSYSYDANGNLTSSPGRGYTWNAENQLTAVTGTANESYTYDGDGERASRTVNGITTVYLGPLLDVDNDTAGTDRFVYMFNGGAIAQRTTTSNPVSNTLVYLHGDHLGSMSLTTSTGGTMVSGQEFDPWGAVRSGGVNETKLNYTGQRKDDTGLLHYHSRYYNPAIARFISADTVVPGMAMGAGGALGTIGMGKNTSHKGLTVDYHEPGINSAVAGENQFTYQHGFWFQLSDRERQQSKTPFGPINPQALNRYSYVVNNPLRYTDPTGHSLMHLYITLYPSANGNYGAVGSLLARVNDTVQNEIFWLNLISIALFGLGGQVEVAFLTHANGQLATALNDAVANSNGSPINISWDSSTNELKVTYYNKNGSLVTTVIYNVDSMFANFLADAAQGTENSLGLKHICTRAERTEDTHRNSDGTTTITIYGRCP
ncbi:MAG: hypothetical protein DLM69_00415 [Candidatus Chloroheliales bacterium]|nr:MAG: hypothetical protein DLM69_00415 [Chloroflexota bacterium]